MAKYYKDTFECTHYAMYANYCVIVEVFKFGSGIKMYDSQYLYSLMAIRNSLEKPLQESTEGEFKAAYKKAMDVITNPEKFGKDG